MANDTTYSGWTNRETWLVNLWFGDYFSDLAEDGERIDARWIEDYIDEHIDNVLGGVGASDFVRDMLDTSGINYAELASHYAPDEPASDDEEG